MMNTAEKIDYSLIPVIEVARLLLGSENRERTHGDERHFDGHGGLFVNLKKNRWYSHGNATGGDAIALIRFATDCDYKAAFDWLRDAMDSRNISVSGRRLRSPDARHDIPLSRCERGCRLSRRSL